MTNLTKLLDCTIRDGGHLNGWNFEPECVRASYFAAVKAGADIFEIGYRFKTPKSEWGLFAKCNDDMLLKLITPNPKCKISVMIDAGKSDADEFRECNPALTIISIVRVATYPQKLEEAFDLCEKLSKKGYSLSLNLMAISEYKETDFDKIKKWKNKSIVETVCFADSFGSFVPNDIEKYYNIIKDLGFKNVSFHSHNNLQLAFANSLRALELGFYSIDASIYGMGRGSGNLPAEIITGYLSKIGNLKYNPVAYIDVIERYYLKLSKETAWGYKIQSLIGGLKNIHPYYVNGLFDKKAFTINEIWTAADLVKKYAPISFSSDNLNNVLSDKFINYDDIKIKDKLAVLPEVDAFKQEKVEFKNLFKDRNFMIIASGSSIKDKLKEIKEFIKEKDCVVIGTNYLENLYDTDFHCFVNRKRFLKYVNSTKSTLLLPSFFGRELVEQNTGNRVMYFDVEITDKKTDNLFKEDTHIYKYLNVAISAIYCAYQMGAKEIYAVGIDGFGKSGNKREYFYYEDDVYDNKEYLMQAYQEFSESLDITNKFLESRSVPFSIITETSHDKYYSNVLGVD